MLVTGDERWVVRPSTIISRWRGYSGNNGWLSLDSMFRLNLVNILLSFEGSEVTVSEQRLGVHCWRQKWTFTWNLTITSSENLNASNFPCNDLLPFTFSRLGNIPVLVGHLEW